jgi:hypothetical protein
MPNEVASYHNDALASDLSSFLAAAYYEPSDEQRGLKFWSCWCAYMFQGLQVSVGGIPLDPIAPEFLDKFLPAFVEAVRGATFRQDTANEDLAGIEKALHRCASGDYAAGGRLLHQFFSRRITLTSAMNELATAHHRQSAFARKGRPDHLKCVLTELVEQNPGITPLEAKEELKRRVGFPGQEPRIHCVDEDAGEVQWYEKGKPELRSAPLSALKDRLHRAKALQKRPNRRSAG